MKLLNSFVILDLFVTILWIKYVIARCDRAFLSYLSVAIQQNMRRVQLASSHLRSAMQTAIQVSFGERYAQSYLNVSRVRYCVL